MGADSSAFVRVVRWFGFIGTFFVIGAGIGFVVSLGAGERTTTRAPGAIRVVVSIPPLAGMVEPLLPEGTEVRVLVPSGTSPHVFAPTPSDLIAIGQADLVVVVGLGIEAGLPPSVRTGGRVLTMNEALGVESGDAHLWLDPVLVESFLPHLAEELAIALERAGAPPEVIAEIEPRQEALAASVREMGESYAAGLAPFTGSVVITQHNAWPRPFGRYGLEIASEIQLAESEPSAAHVAMLIESADEMGVQAVLTEPQLNQAVARRLAEQIDAVLIETDPLGNGDWLGFMQTNLENIVAGLGDLDARAAPTQGAPTSG